MSNSGESRAVRFSVWRTKAPATRLFGFETSIPLLASHPTPSRMGSDPEVPLNNLPRLARGFCWAIGNRAYPTGGEAQAMRRHHGALHGPRLIFAGTMQRLCALPAEGEVSCRSTVVHSL